MSKSLLSSFIFILCTFIACKFDTPPTSTKPKVQSIVGETMGTTYKVLFVASSKQGIKKEVDSLLQTFNQTASTYIPNSTISQFNRNADLSMQSNDVYLWELLQTSKKIYQQTQKHFDPTVMPLVNHWEFGYEKPSAKKDIPIDSLLRLVGFDKIKWEGNVKSYTLQKSFPKMELDFSAVAKGYGVDLVGELLESKQINDYLVEIGGEMRARGQKPDQTWWKVAIDKPLENLKTRQQQAGLELHNQSLATSGNYRNFYERDGKKYVHTIHPKTGQPEISNLLSASIVTSNCIEADAYATACMVMGLKKAKEFVSRHQISALFVFVNSDNELEMWETEGIERIF